MLNVDRLAVDLPKTTDVVHDDHIRLAFYEALCAAIIAHHLSHLILGALELKHGLNGANSNCLLLFILSPADLAFQSSLIILLSSL